MRLDEGEERIQETMEKGMKKGRFTKLEVERSVGGVGARKKT